MPKQTIDISPRDLTVETRTRGGLNVRMRPATPADRDALAAFFTGLSPEDLRHRFLASLKTVDERQLTRMTRNDGGADMTFLSCDAAGGAILAVATLATGLDAARAEVAVSVRSDLKGKGLSWSLLQHVLTHARAQGIKVVESIETADNHPALDLEREMGFTVRPVSDDHGLRLAERAI